MMAKMTEPTAMSSSSSTVAASASAASASSSTNGGSTAGNSGNNQVVVVANNLTWEKLSPAEFQQLQDFAACKSLFDAIDW